MIFTVIALSFIVLTISATIIAARQKNRTLAGILFCFSAVLGLYTFMQVGNVTDSINRANTTKAQIILMKPLEQFRKDIAINEMELAKVERLIDRAVDKNNPNVKVNLEGGVRIYSFLGSSDLGSAELGNAEKQKLLLNYIEKQNEIANKLIYVKKLAYGDHYYLLQQQYAAMSNSVFDGWIVRAFTISENYTPVQNKEYFPMEGGK